MNINFLCTKDWILLDVPYQLWEATTADGQMASVWLTRFLHNKPMFYLNNFFRCYLSYLSPDFLLKAFTIVGLALFIFGLYQVIKLRKTWLIITIILAPLFPLFSFPPGKDTQAILLYGTASLVILFGLWELINIITRKFCAH